MKKYLLYFFAFTCIAMQTHAQQKPNKRLVFCGWKYSDTAQIRNAYGKKLDFLHITDGETIADIGSSSGDFEGSLCVIGDFKNVHFVLVDIDSNCLSNQKVNNMVTFYSQVKGASLQATFSIVQNTVDSLYLRHNTYKKVLLMNTLHEIPDKQKMVRDIYKVMQKGGELIIDELVSRPKHNIHGGCRQPLLDENEIKTLLEQNGFRQADVLLNPSNPKKVINPEYLIRFIRN